MRTRFYAWVVLGVLLSVPMASYAVVNLGNNEGLTGSVGGGIDSYNISKAQQLEVLMQQLNALQVQQRALVQSQTGQGLPATSTPAGSSLTNSALPWAAGAALNSSTASKKAGSLQEFQSAVQRLEQLRTQLQTLQRSVAPSVNSNFAPVNTAVNATAAGTDESNDPSVTTSCDIIPVLNRGGVGASVSALQRALIDDGGLQQGLDTGFYGGLTAAAVKTFQSKNNLPTTGVVDTQTAEALNVAIPGMQRCVPSRMRMYTGILRAASSTPVWGTHVLYADGFVADSGNAVRLENGARIAYKVKAASDTVLANLKTLEGKRVTITGDLTLMNRTGVRFWGLVAQNVSLTASTTGPGVSNGGGTTGGGVTGSGSGSGSSSGSGSGSGTAGGGSAGTTLVISGSTTLPTALLGQPYSATISVTGGSGQYQWTFISGDPSNQFANSFPSGSGLSMSGGSGSSVTIGGTPVAFDSGKEYFFALKVVSGSESATKNFILYVSPATSDGSGTAVSVVLVTPPNWQEPGTVGQPYSTTFVAANEPEGTYRWSITDGSLPPGLSLTGGNNSQTTIAGTPTLSGGYSFKLQVSSTYGGSMQNQYGITIYPGTATSSTSTSGGGTGTQDTSDASSQQSVLMASVLESMKSALQQILGSLSF